MARQFPFGLTRRRRRGFSTTPSPYAEWRHTMRDTGDMLSGIYQDLRGDLSDSLATMAKGVRANMRRVGSNLKQ